MKKLLLALADRPTPQIPESWFRYVDRYTRRPRHADRTIGAGPQWTGWGIVARVRNDRALAALGY